jgi:hypothetical protein
MKKVRKKAMLSRAFQLGRGDLLEKTYIKNGLIKKEEDFYQVFSLEVGGGKKGERAESGDFVKIDIEGNIYPNKKDFFLENHKKISKNYYLTRPKTILARDRFEEKSDLIEKLVEKGLLKINETSKDKYFEADIYKTRLFGKKDDLILIYSHQGSDPADWDFNIIDRKIFEKTYQILEKKE